MTAYLFTFRQPAAYEPTASTFDDWARWQLKLGARLKDRGNPAFTATSLGASVTETTLGGYSVIRAVSLDEAVALARACPLLDAGGTVEVAELTETDEMFGTWLASH